MMTEMEKETPSIIGCLSSKSKAKWHRRPACAAQARGLCHQSLHQFGALPVSE
jgi:hypothetical protein